MTFDSFQLADDLTGSIMDLPVFSFRTNALVSDAILAEGMSVLPHKSDVPLRVRANPLDAGGCLTAVTITNIVGETKTRVDFRTFSTNKEDCAFAVVSTEMFDVNVEVAASVDGVDVIDEDGEDFADDDRVVADVCVKSPPDFNVLEGLTGETVVATDEFFTNCEEKVTGDDEFPFITLAADSDRVFIKIDFRDVIPSLDMIVTNSFNEVIVDFEYSGDDEICGTVVGTTNTAILAVAFNVVLAAVVDTA